MIRKFLLLALLFAVAGCNDKNDLKNIEIEVLSVYQSECKGNRSTKAYDESEKLVIRSTGGDNYSIQHLNVVFNCCLPEGLAVEVAFKNDTIFYTEKEKEMGTCRCLCPYDFSAELGDIIAGEYVLCLIKESIRLGTITLFFNNNLNEEILVSELKDYPYL